MASTFLLRGSLLAAILVLADSFAVLPSLLSSQRAAFKSATTGRRCLFQSSHGRTLPHRSRASILGLRAEERKFSVGDVVEAQWIGDDSWYAAKIEGLWANGAYDVMWADPQGMAPTQATLENAIRPFDVKSYYRFGLNALENEDAVTAYLAFRTIWVLMGGVGKTKQMMEELSSHPSVAEIIAERNEQDLLTRGAAQSVTYSEEVKKEMAESKEEDENNMYSQEELVALREEAKAESITQDMWKQYNVFQESQAGVWKGVWTDYAFTKDELVEAGSREGTTELTCRINDGGFPEHSMRVDVDGKVELELEKQGFFPATDCSWFVGNAHTQARLDDKELVLEVGLRHTDSRVRVMATYKQGDAAVPEKGSTWGLQGVTVAREALDREPTPDMDPCLFSAKFGADKAGSEGGTLSGPADRLSTQLYNAQASQPVVSIRCQGAVSVTCPTSLPEKENPPTNKELVLEWSTTARPGIAWDGKERIIPALHYRCARVFKRPSEAIEMLSLTENAPA